MDQYSSQIENDSVPIIDQLELETQQQQTNQENESTESQYSKIKAEGQGSQESLLEDCQDENDEERKKIKAILDSNKIHFHSPQTNQVIIKIVEKQNKTNRDIQVINKAIESFPAFSSRDSVIPDSAAANAMIVKLSKSQILYSFGDASETYYVLLEGFCYLLVPRKRDEGINSQNQKDYEYEEKIQLKDKILLSNYRRLQSQTPENVFLEGGMSSNSLFKEQVVIKKFEIGATFGDLTLLTNKKMMSTVVCGSDCTFLALNKSTFLTIALEEDKNCINERLDIISKVPFLEKVPFFKIILLIQDSIIKTAKLGQKIFKLGDPSNQIFFILQGSIQLSKKVVPAAESTRSSYRQNENALEDLNVNEQRRHELEQSDISPIVILDEGKYFGEEELLRGEKTRLSQAQVVSRYAKVIAVDKSMLFWITREDGALKRIFEDCEMKSQFQSKREVLLETGMRKNLLLKRQNYSQQQLLISHQSKMNQSNISISNIEASSPSKQATLNIPFTLESSPSRKHSSNSQRLLSVFQTMNPSPSNRLQALPNTKIPSLVGSVTMSPLRKSSIRNSFSKKDFSSLLQKEQFPQISNRDSTHFKRADSISSVHRDSNIPFYGESQDEDFTNRKKDSIFSPTKRHPSYRKRSSLNSQRKDSFQQGESITGGDTLTQNENKSKRVKVLSILDLKKVSTSQYNNGGYINDNLKADDNQIVRKEKEETPKEKYSQFSTFQKVKTETHKSDIRKQKLQEMIAESKWNQPKVSQSPLFFQGPQIFNQFSQRDNKENFKSNTSKMFSIPNKNNTSSDQQQFSQNILPSWNILLAKASLELASREHNTTGNETIYKERTLAQIQQDSISELFGRKLPNNIMKTFKKKSSKKKENSLNKSEEDQNISNQQSKPRKKKKGNCKPKLDLLNCLYEGKEETQRLVRYKQRKSSTEKFEANFSSADVLRSSLCTFVAVKHDEEQDKKIFNAAYPIGLSPRILSQEKPIQSIIHNFDLTQGEKCFPSSQDLMKHSKYQNKSQLQSALSSPMTFRGTQTRDDLLTPYEDDLLISQQFKSQQQWQQSVHKQQHHLWKPQPQQQLVLSIEREEHSTDKRSKICSLNLEQTIREKISESKDKQKMLSSPDFKQKSLVNFNHLINQKSKEVDSKEKVVNFHTFNLTQRTIPQKSYMRMKLFSTHTKVE